MLSKRFGNGSKTMLLMWLVLCSACPPICWADVVLTDTEATALKMSLQTAKKELDEQEKQIEKLRSQLNGQKRELENARLQLEKSQTETRELQNSLTRLSTFWKELRKIRTQYMKDVGSDTSRWISFYEHSNVKNINEFMAEAFTQVKLKELGFKIPDHYGKDFTYSRQVVNLIDKYFKRAEPGKIIFHSEKTRELLNKQKPVDPVILNKVKINLNAQGYDVRQDQATDEYLESRGKEAQIIASNEKTLVCLHTKLSASGLFEELIHLNQIKKMKEYSIKHNDTDVIENEIKAKEKVLKHRKSYNITEDEVAFLEKSINQYRRELNEIRNKN